MEITKLTNALLNHLVYDNWVETRQPLGALIRLVDAYRRHNKMPRLRESVNNHNLPIAAEVRGWNWANLNIADKDPYWVRLRVLPNYSAIEVQVQVVSFSSSDDNR